MAQTKIPAPERDLKNVEPHVPPASRELSPVTRGIFSSVAIAFGVAVLVLALLGAVLQTSPLPQNVFDAGNLIAVLFAALTGLCLIGCGVGIAAARRSCPLVLLVASLLCGMAATAIAQS